MKPRFHQRHLPAVFVIGGRPSRSILTGSIAGLLASFASAAPLTWDGNAATVPNPNGGTGTWDTTSSNWWNGSTNVLWPASGTDNDAVFANTAGTVSLAAAGVTANDLTFNTTGYLIQSNTLTLNGTTPTITAGAGISATISSIIAGSSGMTKAGQGTLILTGANSYTAGTTISGGTLQIGDAAVNGTLGTGTYSIANGAKLSLNYLTAAAPTWANITGAGTLELNSAQAVNGSANWGTVSLGAGFTGTLQLDKGRVTAPLAGMGGTTKVVLGNGSQFLAYDGTNNGTAYTYAQSFSINGMGWGEGSQDQGAIRVSGMNATFSGGITLTGNSGLYTQSGASTMTVSGLISDGGSGFGLTINNAGSGITLSNTGNSYGGGTTVSTGTLKLGAANVIPDGVGKGDVTVTSTLNLNTFSETINGLTGAGTVDNTAAGTPTLTVGNSDATSNFGGVIKNTAGTLSLTKIGTGTLTLSGANTYTGTTTIANGTLAFSTVSPSLTGGVTFGAAAGNATAVGALDVTGVASTATFTGALLVQTNNAAANTINVGSKTLTINGGMTLGYDAGSGTGTTNSKLTVTGAGTLAVNGTTITLGVNQAATNAAYFSTGTLDVTGLGNFTTNVTNLNIGVASTTGSLGNLLLSNTANTLKATTLAVGDSGGNNSNGTSNLTLGTGTNVINADTINIGRAKSSGNFKFASQTAGSPGTVTIANKTGSGAANINVASVNGVSTSGALTGTLNLTGHVATVNVDTLLMGQNNMPSNSGPATATVSFDAGTFTVATLTMAPKSAAGTGNANATLNVGGGAFTVSTAFTFGSQATAGASFPTLNITGGTFTTSANIVEGGGTVTSVINLNGPSAVLDMGGGGLVHNLGDATNVINTFTYTDGTLRNIGTVFGGITLAGSGSRVFDQTGSLSGEVKGVISGSGIGLQKTGSGTITLSGANTYDGLTTVGAGELDLNKTGGQSIAGNLTVSGGTAKLLQASQINSARNLVVSSGTFNIQGFNQTLANVQLTGGSINGTTGVLTSAAAYDMQAGSVGAILGGSVALNKTTGGTVTLTGANTYSGLTTISAGTLAAGVTNAIGTGAVTVDGASAIYSLGTFSDTVGTVTLDGGGQINSSSGTLSTTGTFEMKRGSASAILAGSGALNKTTGGTVTLTGANTYSGATTVSSGTLVVGGSLSGTSTVSVAAGATLASGSGGGSITTGATTGTAINVTGVLSPGGAVVAPISLTLAGTSKLNFDDGSQLLIDLAGAGSSDTVVFGSAGDWLTSSGSSTLALNGVVDYTSTYTVFSNVTTTGFNFTDITGYDTANYIANFHQSGSNYDLSFVAVPEPNASTCVIGGLGMLLLFRRR